ncbi:protein NLRC3-like isoform X1 [Mugil cephalus]|uniref:protein NLRC3-like isoform X1 n=1 Tax=Mugil cephalus TaxID=48193 RepID=UPI001FB80B57|nr:protein NLRC3-like isoform X1 [Mugil cephalus]
MIVSCLCTAVVSAMNRCGKMMEGNTPPPEILHSGKPGSKISAQSPEQQQEQQRPDSPAPSCVSMKSDWSMPKDVNFKSEQMEAEIKSPEQQQRPDSPDCVSMKSDHSMGRIEEFKAENSDGGKPEMKRHVQEISEVSHDSSAPQCQPDLSSIFMRLEENIISFVKNELKSCQRVMRADYPECLEKKFEDEEVMDSETEEQMKDSREAFMKIVRHFLRTMKEDDIADCLQTRAQGAVCRRQLKSNLKKRFQCVFEGIAKAGNPALLNQIYTELYITEGETAEVNNEHEVRHIEVASRKSNRPETSIRQEDLFKASPERHGPIRRVMTKGVAGIGKTVLTQKFTLDWAEDKANQDILFIFPLTFRELNVVKERKFSLVELVHHFFTETKEAGICSFEDFQVVFIFDGLDECRLPLDFHNTEILTDVTESTSVDVLLTNLIRGKLLPSARLWITTRRAAANQIPPECVDMVTEVRGFTDPQKEVYFRKRFRDEEQASRIISHIKTSRSLHIMCHIPVFCWITATVLEDVLETREGGKLPKTLTEMYIHFLVVQAKVKKVRYDGGAETDPHWSPENRNMIKSLGKLAFDQLLKGNLIFYESDLTECGIDIRAASMCSGVFTQIFKEERGLYQDKVFCFVHLSVQEFLAALYVHLTFINAGVNPLSDQKSFQKECTLTDLHKCAVDQALQSPNGHLDLFVRFLLGLSLPTNQTLLRGLLTQTGSREEQKKTADYIKKVIRENSSPEKSINLFHCLSELRNSSIVAEIQQHLRSGSLFSNRLSPDQWSALVYIIQSSEDDLNVFDLKKYCASEKALLGLLPLLKASAKALLNGCNLSPRSCDTLALVLKSQAANVKELDLSNNDLQDSGVDHLCAALKSPHCKLEKLRLTCCNLSERSCEHLASVLSSQSSCLKELDLSNNDLQDSGVKLLCGGLGSLCCTLETLRMSGCLITKDGCASLASALSSNPVHLRELDLSFNHPEDSGKEQLSAGLKDQQWKLDKLRMDNCGVQRLIPGIRKYACEVSLDPNTAHRNLYLTEDNRRVISRELQPHPDHPERFDFWPQVLCTEALSDRSYWEVECRGDVHVAVTYRGIRRKGDGNECKLGGNDQSWSLHCFDRFYSFHHDNEKINAPLCSYSVSHRIAVYLDCPAGMLSFYKVTHDDLVPLHTFYCTFSEPLHPAFSLGFSCSSTSGPGLTSRTFISLCSL